MNRGDIWSAATRGAYTSKPRPVVLLQDERFDLDSVTVCAVTGTRHDAPLFRVPVEPDQHNGLAQPCDLMADKLTTIPRAALGDYIGRLSAEHMLQLERVILTFLGFAG